jgi:hypothetical protein
MNQAILYDLADVGQLSDHDAELVRRHIPETRSVRCWRGWAAGRAGRRRRCAPAAAGAC